MKVLIVDDIEDNREILEKLIIRYTKEHEETWELFFACDGQEAVNLCAQQEMDLVFMDIKMPIMDGLQATKIIKKSSPHALIIVVSSENDEAVKVDILNAGAEDYINKPYSSAIMSSRLSNYHKLVLSRNSIGFQSRAINTFTNNVYSYQMKFFAGSDDELAQFWETMLMRLEFQHHISALSDFVRFLYHLGSYQVKKSYKCHIFVEEDKDHFYFTMDNMKLLSQEAVVRMIEKYWHTAHYKIKDDYLSFVLNRVVSQEEDLLKPSEVKFVKQQNTDSKPIEENPANLTLSKPIAKQTLQTYADILDEQSLSEFEHVVTKLKTEISMMGSSTLELDDIDTMNAYIKELERLLSISSDAYSIAESLSIFSLLLDEYSGDFLAKSKDVSSMVEAFVNDLIMWKEMVFYTGAPSVDFLNSSISSSVGMIRAVFVNESADEGELDDIFDF